MAVITTTVSFSNNEQVTSTKLNNITAQSSFTNNAVVGDTLQVVGGALKVKTITSSEISDGAVTTPAISNESVTVAKLSQGAPSWDSSGNFTVSGAATNLSNVTTGDAAVDIGAGRTASGKTFIDFNSTYPLTSTFDARISRESGTNGNLVVTNNGTGSLVLGTAPIPTPSGSAPVYGSRAWVVFDMTKNSSGGTDALLTDRFIIGSGNVTSVKKDATGDFTVTFTTAFSDANYAYSGSGINTASGGGAILTRLYSGAKTSSTMAMRIMNDGGTAINSPEVSAVFFR